MLLQLSAARSQISRALVALVVMRLVVGLEHAVGDGGVAAVVHRDGYAEEYLVREMRRLQSLHETLYRLLYASVLQQYVSAYHVYLAAIAVGVFERLVETLERLLHMSEQRKRERTALVHLSRA